MRIKNRTIPSANDYRLMIIDDDAGLIDSISNFLTRNGYDILGLINPLEGLDRLKEEKYDLLILDYFMSPIKGDDFVSKLREFDNELYVILLTGHKDLAPPLATIKAFEIQAYCEKSHRLDQLILMIESGIKSISQMRRISNYRDGLDNILKMLPAINVIKPTNEILDTILEQIVVLTNNEDAFALIDGFGEKDQVIYSGVGKFNVSPEETKRVFDEALLEKIDKAKKSRTTLWADEGVFFPIISGNDFYEGILFIAGKIEESSRNLLEVFIIQVAVLIQNAHLHERLSLAYSNLKSSFVETIEALRLAVDAKDVYTRGHSDRVSMYSRMIGMKLSMKKEELEDLRIAGLFHDIGKIGTSDEILLKSSGLTTEEYDDIKEHPTKGALILSAVTAFEKVKDIVCSHHERIDGKGYPKGLKGDEIPFGAKIVCVADAYDAMTFDRQYRGRLDHDVAIEQLLDGRGNQFDAGIVDCFITVLEENHDDISKTLLGTG